ncbi:MAG TPA: S46 family peptidase [Myxococcales bacterium]|jgi:hypothetical protein
MFRSISAVLAASLLAAAPLSGRADEGMWLFNDFPSSKVKAKYGFEPDQKWLDHVRLSSVRLAEGCSGSIVSGDGLVMTNHHCAHSCIEQLSSAKKDYVASGFYARKGADEVKCPEIEINQLVEIADVTERIGAATRGLPDAGFNEALKAEMSRIEKECDTGPGLRCDVVTLYHGARYHLYKYRRFQDVRLAFAPEFAIAFFGGDPDNFEFPRYDLDVSFLRIYQDGQPAKTPDFLPFAKAGPKDGDLVFVSGHPGGTNRLTPLAQLEVDRDVSLTRRLMYSSELKGLLTRFATESPEKKRISNALLFFVENGIKARKGRLSALQDKAFFGQLQGKEALLRAKVDADPALKALYGGAWDQVQKAMDRFRVIRDRYSYVEEGRGFASDLFKQARLLVREAEELPKPNEKRLREYADSNQAALKNEIASPAPVYDDLELLTLSFSLSKLREDLGPDDPVVKDVLGKLSPEQAAKALVKGSKLRDPKVRKALLEGGTKAIEASTDPMIRLAKRLDPAARAVRKTYEDEVEAPVKKNNELIAKAHSAIYGTSTYPDATFTLRLTYGAVKGWTEPDGKEVKPLTTLGGAFERATGSDPFRLPDTWTKAKAKLDLSTPFDLATTNDIIGGNSGSPVVNQQGEAAGLVFDGNIWSLAGDYGYDEALNRCVAVHSAALLETLDKIYGATRIAEELRAGRFSSRETGK